MQDPWNTTANPHFQVQTAIVYYDPKISSLVYGTLTQMSPVPTVQSDVSYVSVGTLAVAASWTLTTQPASGAAPPSTYQVFHSLSIDPDKAAPTVSATSVPTSTSKSAAGSASTSSSSASGSTNAQNDKVLSSGAAAGVGVGAAIGGILLASLAFFICFRRSRKSQPRYDSEVPLKRTPSYGEGKPTSLPQITAIGTWESQAEKLLPQPVADDSISTEMSKLKSMINNHVVSYYRTSEIDLDSIDETALAGIVEDPQISVSQLRSAIVDPQTRTPALRYLIASAIFSRIGLKSHPSTSLLPPEVASCLESMNGLRENDQGPFYLHFKLELKAYKKTARTTLFSKWRAITASMLQQTYGSNFITESDPRSYNIGHALEELDSVLVRLRARRDENASRRQNLEEILKRAAGFAFLLFSHPSFWKFEWLADSNHGPGSVVIFPALLQITDENGERLSRPRPFEDMEIARLAT